MMPYELRHIDFEASMQDVYDVFFDVNSFPSDAAQSADRGVEVKTTRKPGGGVDMHGARDQTICVFVYRVDDSTEPADARAPMTFREVYIQHVVPADFRRNPRGELGTRTATLHKDGLAKLRSNWVYLPA